MLTCLNHYPWIYTGESSKILIETVSDNKEWHTIIHRTASFFYYGKLRYKGYRKNRCDIFAMLAITNKKATRLEVA